MILVLEEKVRFKGAVRTRTYVADSSDIFNRTYNRLFKGVLLSLRVINRYPDLRGEVAEVNNEKGFVTWHFRNNGEIMVKFTRSRYEWVAVNKIKKIPKRREGEAVTIKKDISGVPFEGCNVVEEMKVRQGQTLRIVRVMENSRYKLEGSGHTWSEMCFE